MQKEKRGQSSGFDTGKRPWLESYRFWLDLCIRMIKLVVFGPLNINHSIDYGVRDMDALGSELSR